MPFQEEPLDVEVEEFRELVRSNVKKHLERGSRSVTNSSFMRS